MRRSNPDCCCGKTLDCFAPLAMTMWMRRAQLSDRHPEALASSARLEGRRPGCGSWAVHPSRLRAHCFAAHASRLQRQRLRRCAGMTGWELRRASYIPPPFIFPRLQIVSHPPRRFHFPGPIRPRINS
ncbi:hypothetical protein XH96_07400 [Bradyrhizobium sp. CCBAU 51765]|nr:hypothetical protein XH96_07400 [Bradyrhizobium sp. CCBAU 51765]